MGHGAVGLKMPGSQNCFDCEMRLSVGAVLVAKFHQVDVFQIFPRLGLSFRRCSSRLKPVFLKPKLSVAEGCDG